MRSAVDRVGIWKDADEQWHWTAFIGDQPYTNSEGYETEQKATEEADKNYPDLVVSEHTGDDPTTFKFEGEI